MFLADGVDAIVGSRVLDAQDAAFAAPARPARRRLQLRSTRRVYVGRVSSFRSSPASLDSMAVRVMLVRTRVATSRRRRTDRLLGRHAVPQNGAAIADLDWPSSAPPGPPPDPGSSPALASAPLPRPRCVTVSAEHWLRIANEGPATTVTGASVTSPLPIGAYADAGLHTLEVERYGGSGPEVRMH